MVGELEQAHALTLSILRTSQDGILVTDRGGKIELANLAADHLFGYATSGLPGTEITAVLKTGKGPGGVDLLEELAETSTAADCNRCEVMGVKRDGSLLPLSLTVGKISVGGQVSYTCVVRDIRGQQTAVRGLREGENRGRSAADNGKEVVVPINGTHPEAVRAAAAGGPDGAMQGLTGQLAALQSLGGDALVAELLAEFQLQVEADLSGIAAAAGLSDYIELSRLAHRLKGASTAVGVTAVTDLCTGLEKAAADQDDRKIAAFLGRLTREVTRTRNLQGGLQVPSRHVRILIADDHPVVRFGVRRMLQSHQGCVVVGEASDGKEAIRQMREMQPDILLLDLNMPLLPGLETLRELTTIQVPTRTVLLTSAISQREVLEALQLGARGVVLKDALTDDLSACISTVMDGHYWLGRKPVKDLVQVLNGLMEGIKQPPKNTFGLTARELEIVRLIAQGMTNKDMARECEIAEETVKRHLKNIFDKVGLWNRLELAIFAINNHLVADTPMSA